MKSDKLPSLTPKLDSVDSLVDLLSTLGLAKEPLLSLRKDNNQRRVDYIARQLLSHMEYDMFSKLKNGPSGDCSDQDDQDYEDHFGFQRWLRNLP